MKTIFDDFKKSECNGCGACSLICPQNAIKMKEDEEGFLYPELDKSKCVECGLCLKRCSNRVKINNKEQHAYAVCSKDINVKKKSSSGGIFFEIAKNIIDKCGVVFGVEIDNNLIVKHNYVENEKDIIKFQGSKYVRSDLNNSYEKVKSFLEDDRYVLFTGTPCQCQGLKSFLNKNYDKLFVCEIVCHANPSPKVFDLYKKNKEKIKNKKIKKILFRTKEENWIDQIPLIEYEDGEKEFDKCLRRGFGAELINRPSCYNCIFCGINRDSDFTIGDFWGISKIDPEIVNKDGISLLIISSEKGKALLNEIRDRLIIKEEKIEDALKYNHNSNKKEHNKRNEFFYKIENGTINETNIIKHIYKYSNGGIFSRILKKIKKEVNKILKLK